MYGCRETNPRLSSSRQECGGRRGREFYRSLLAVGSAGGAAHKFGPDGCFVCPRRRRQGGRAHTHTSKTVLQWNDESYQTPGLPG
ncbi:hypothetical protein AAHC03_018939 [Spirometra sp. Aus1]